VVRAITKEMCRRFRTEWRGGVALGCYRQKEKGEGGKVTDYILRIKTVPSSPF